MIDELERGIAATYVGLRDGTLPPARESSGMSTTAEPLAASATEADRVADDARNLADALETLNLANARVRAALAGDQTLPEFFIREVWIGLNGLDALTATFFPATLDILLTQERSRESLLAFGGAFNPLMSSVVSQMTDDDVDETYRLLEELRPTVEIENTITLDIITCNDRYGSFDLEALFDEFRSFEVPGLINRVDVAVNAKVICTLWGLTPSDSDLAAPVVTDLTILVSNGSVDAETPVEWGEAAYAGLTNAYFVTFAYAPHGASAQFDCGPAVAAAFILDPSRMPNVSCADDLQREVFPFAIEAQ
jgi:hypothetical protein